MSLNRITNFVGIDVSKRWFNACVLRSDYRQQLDFQCDNTDLGISDFLKKLKSHKVPISKSTIITVEHTGLYTRLLVDRLSSQNILLVVEMALRIRKGLGIIRGKKDTIDCKRIAEYTMRHLDNLYLYVKKPKELETVRRLLKNRERLLKAKLGIITPIMELKGFVTISEHRASMSINKECLDAINRAIENILAIIDEMVASDVIMARQLELLLSIPGVGKLTAIQLICDTNYFQNCDSVRQLSSYCGVAPFEVSSGTATAHAHISKISNRTLKGLLFLAALTQVRTKNELRDYYERKVKEGKPKNVVLNNVSNKILHRVWAVIQRDSEYTPIYKRRRVLPIIAGLS